jgi:type VII secretion-associated serine protease mycosin
LKGPAPLGAATITGLIIAMALTRPAVADPIRDDQWHLRFLKIAEAHEHSKGDGVVVAVVDTGVDATHPDLKGSVLPGIDFTAIGAGGDGRTDLDGHGTAMAGIIAAHGRALGIAPGAKVLPVRDSAFRVGFGSPLALAIDWAVANGAQVICLAVATENAEEHRHAIERAFAADVVVVAGVGNRPDANRVKYPAAYPGVLAAGGVDRNGKHADIAVTGPEVVLAAPAVAITSTGRNGGYVEGTGTSDATAIIAGAAALVRAKYPSLSAVEVVHRLIATADDKGPPGRDEQYGFGVLNLVRALTADVPPLSPTPNAPPTASNENPSAAAAPPTQGGDRTRVVVAIVGSAALLLLATGCLVWAFRRRAAIGL